MRCTNQFAGTLLVTVATTLLLVACGSGDGDATTSTAERPTSNANLLTHVDGTLAMDGDTLVVTPVADGAAIRMTLGPEVERGALQSVVTAGGRARVLYADGDAPVAARVEAVPEVSAEAKSYEGLVTKVTVGTLSIDGADGTRTFVVAAPDRRAFDLEHLEEHRDSGERIKVYYRAEGGADTAISYEDAS